MQQNFVGGDNSMSNSSMSNDSQRQPSAADSDCKRQHQPSAAAATATATTTTACRSASRLGKAPSALPPAFQCARLDAPLDQDTVEGSLMRINAPETEMERDGRRTGRLQMYKFLG